MRASGVNTFASLVGWLIGRKRAAVPLRHAGDWRRFTGRRASVSSPAVGGRIEGDIASRAQRIVAAAVAKARALLERVAAALGRMGIDVGNSPS